MLILYVYRESNMIKTRERGFQIDRVRPSRRREWGGVNNIVKCDDIEENVVIEEAHIV